MRDIELLEYFDLKDVKKASAIIIRILERWGYTFTQAKVYAILVLSPIPLTTIEIAKIAGLSRSAISTVLGKLAKDYLVHYHIKGKTKYYTALPSLTSIFIKQLTETLEKEIKPLEQIMKKIAERNIHVKEYYSYILSDISNTHKKLQKCVEIFDEKY